jgi:hypothetical protein
MCGLYEENREFRQTADQFFKTSGHEDLRLLTPATLVRAVRRLHGG